MLPTDHATLVALDAAADRLCEHAVGLEPVVGSHHDAYVVMVALVALVGYEPPQTLAERLELDLGRMLDGEPPVPASPPSHRRAGDAQAAVEGFLLSRGVAAQRAAGLAGAVSGAAARLLADI